MYEFCENPILFNDETISRSIITPEEYCLPSLSTKYTPCEAAVYLKSDYPFMHLLYSQLLVCQRVCLQNTVCLICK